MDQALPNNYPDLNTLFQYMPAIAAGQVGTQQRIADQNNQSLQDAFRTNEAYQQQKRPIELQQAQAGVGNTLAQTAFHDAQARSSNLNSDLKQGTLSSDIQVGNSTNKTKLGADEIAQLEQAGDLYRQVGAQVAGEPTPWGKVAKAKAILGDHVQQGPEFDQFLMKHSGNLHTYFNDLGNNIYDASRAAKMEASKEASANQRTTTQVEGSKDVAKMYLEGGRWDRTGKAPLTLDESIDKEGDPIKKYTQLTIAAQQAAQDGDPVLAQKYADKAMAIKTIAEQVNAARGGGAQIVQQQPGGKPVLAPRGGNTVSLPTPLGNKAGTKENPIKLD